MQNKPNVTDIDVCCKIPTSIALKRDKMLFPYHTEQTGHEFRVDQAVIYTTGVNYKKTSHFAALGLFH